MVISFYIFTNGDPELDGCCEAPLLGRFWVPIFWEDCNVIGDWPCTGVFPFFPFFRSSFVQIFFTEIKTNEELRSDGIYHLRIMYVLHMLQYLLLWTRSKAFFVTWILVLLVKQLPRKSSSSSTALYSFLNKYSFENLIFLALVSSRAEKNSFLFPNPFWYSFHFVRTVHNPLQNRTKGKDISNSDKKWKCLTL